MFKNDLLLELIDIMVIVSFHNSLQSCVAGAGRHSDHSVEIMSEP